MTTIDEPLTESDRRRLLDLLMAAVPRDRGDDELTRLIAKLSGVDTIIVARRAYPSSRLRSDAFHDAYRP